MYWIKVYWYSWALIREVDNWIIDWRNLGLKSIRLCSSLFLLRSNDNCDTATRRVNVYIFHALNVMLCRVQNGFFNGKWFWSKFVWSDNRKTLFYILLDTYHCKNTMLNLTSMYLLGTVCCQHIHRGQIWCWVLICTLW